MNHVDLQNSNQEYYIASIVNIILSIREYNMVHCPNNVIEIITVFIV